MKIFCTLSDSNYLAFGLAMYRSLRKVNPNFVLYYLCLDDRTYKIISDLNYPDLRAIGIFEIDSPKLQYFKGTTIHENYCWALASYFTDWLMNTLMIPSITYIDSDIYFYSDWEPFFKEIGDKDVGIVTHRFTHNKDTKTGKYNVGVIYFKASENGRACLRWWRDVVIDPQNKYFKTHGTCGDQKYLELFEPLFGNICVVDNIGHLASWNAKDHVVIGNDIIWQRKVQRLIWFHISHFKPDYKHNTYRTNKRGEWYPERVPGVKRLLDEYFEELKKINRWISNR